MNKLDCADFTLLSKYQPPRRTKCQICKYCREKTERTLQSLITWKSSHWGQWELFTTFPITSFSSTLRVNSGRMTKCNTLSAPKITDWAKTKLVQENMAHHGRLLIAVSLVLFFVFEIHNTKMRSLAFSKPQMFSALADQICALPK